MDKCPLTGDDCPYKRTIHATEVENYQATSFMDMCVLCGLSYLGKEVKIFNNPLFDIINMFIKEKAIIQGQIEIESQVKKPCPTCGTSLDNIGDTGKLGCANCYEHFKDELGPLIKKYQNASEHKGKRPSKKTLKELQVALEEAIKQENYLEAAKLRDEIKKLQ